MFALIFPFFRWYFNQRQVVDKRVWRELSAFFPRAEAFRADGSSECPECLGDSVSLVKAEEAVKRARQQEIALPLLKALYSRKTGVRSNSRKVKTAVTQTAVTRGSAYV